jgi:hypothetical protein
MRHADQPRSASLLPRALPLTVHSIEIEALRVKHAAYPAQVFLVLIVASIGEGIEEFAIKMRTSDIIWRPGILTRYAQR